MKLARRLMRGQTGAGGWSPADLTTVAWFDASESSTVTESSGAVSSWGDRAGVSDPATQSNSTYKPTLISNALNGLSVIEFNGDYLSRAALLPSTFSFLAVVKNMNITVNECRIVSQSPGGADANRMFVYAERNTSTFRSAIQCGGTFASFTGTRTGEYRIYANTRNGASVGFNVDGLRGSGSTSTASASTASFYIGGAPFDPNYAYLRVAEIVVVSSVLSLDDIQKWEGYSAHKWGLTSNLPSDHPYKTTAP